MLVASEVTMESRTHALDLTTRSILQAAALAPSSHNTQPWRLRALPGAIELHADRTRALAVNDPDDRELTISCGCALFNLRVAAAHYRFASAVELLPDGAESDLLARVRLHAAGTDAHLDDSAEARLFPAIAQRRTYRRRFTDTPVSERARHELERAAQLEGCTLTLLAGDAARHATARLVAEGDALQWASASWRRELAAWMHPRRQGDGLAVPGLVAPLAHAVVRTFDMGHGVGARDTELAEASPLLGVLTSPGDGPRDWLAAGQALERALLTACGLGLQASFLNQPCQVPALRAKLQHLLGAAGFPQILMRLGFPATEVPATARRTLEELLD